MDSRELHTIVKKQLSEASVSIADSSYESPKISWIENNLYPKSFLPWIKENGLTRWKEHWDCDNFAYAFFTFAQMCHARTSNVLTKQGKTVKEGLGVGVMYYITRKDPATGQGGGGHAINFIVSKGEFYAFEPQTGKVVELTKEELDSCWFAVI